MAEHVIEIKGLKKSFGENHVLDGFDLNVPRGNNVVVLGKSGSGKSVLIKCIVRLLEPDEGSISVLGENVLEMDHDELDRMRVRIGFLFQNSALYDSMTVRENLEFPMRRHWFDITKDDADQRVNEALENVGLLSAADMMPSDLSGG
ncbi:MAG: ABC transporter ATP-binding protein, partial [Bacteroidota bacterium]